MYLICRRWISPWRLNSETHALGTVFPYRSTILPWVKYTSAVFWMCTKAGTSSVKSVDWGGSASYLPLGARQGSRHCPLASEKSPCARRDGAHDFLLRTANRPGTKFWRFARGRWVARLQTCSPLRACSLCLRSRVEDYERGQEQGDKSMFSCFLLVTMLLIHMCTYQTIAIN